MKSKRYRDILSTRGFKRLKKGREGLYYRKSSDGQGYDITCIPLEKWYDKGVVLTDIGYVKDEY